MNDARFDSLTLALHQPPLARRGVMRGLAGLTGLVGLALVGLGDAEARKRKKKRKKKGKGKGGNRGERCNKTVCEGQCVDLDTDPDNCGACGAVCLDDVACVSGRCVLAIGERGDGVFQFDGPLGLAFGANGVAQLADANNRRGVRFSREGLFGVFGELGEEDGQFLRPSGVAVNVGTGDVYVTDVERHCVQRFSDRGDFEATFGFFGGGSEQLNVPSALAIDQQSGNVYITDTGNNQIKELNANLFRLSEIRLVNGPGQFARPEGIALDGNRNLVVADTGNDRIVVTDRDGNFILAFGQTGSANGEFDRPVAVAINRGGIFVVDQGNNRVQQFSADGQFVAAFGRVGAGIGEFDTPTGIATDGDVIGVVDTGNNRVQLVVPAARP
jgi:DNA-binding beta-propeller fold protein YncE